ncbi:TIGR02996 domain-containing protein [Thalassoroseus pseudoceratinae]|uniref:TIGR02996 domain-containing protein n=1 Tax=Thalassoroseus pseudoceratinae TaxID=2713176 RepID=UPI0014242461|nr:TIGR02996 domain-containing protein [Thalassoroseus pseudoceratinae]
MSSSAEQSFLQAVLDDPDDDLPRLAYADWLDEQGDPRGELIRVQCELFPLTEEDERFRPLYKREQTLLKRYKSEWLGPLGRLTQNPKFYRGFVENVQLGSKQFLARRQKVFSLAPIRVLTITAMSSKYVSDFVAAEEWTGLRELSLSIREMTVQEWRELMTASQMKSLQRLRLTWWELDRQLLSFLTELAARNLHEFEIVGQTWRNQVDWNSLFASGVFSSLRTFELGIGELQEDLVDNLLSRSQFPHLENLILNSLGSVQPIGQRRLQSIGKHPGLAQLRSLAIQSLGMTMNESIATHLFPHPESMQLERLALKGHAVNEDGIRRIAQIPNLKTLKLDICRLGDECVSILADSEQLQSLRILSLTNNELTDAAAEAILKSPHLSHLLALDLSQNAISKDTQTKLRKRFGAGVCTFTSMLTPRD